MVGLNLVRDAAARLIARKGYRVYDVIPRQCVGGEVYVNAVLLSDVEKGVNFAARCVKIDVCMVMFEQNVPGKDFKSFFQFVTEMDEIFRPVFKFEGRSMLVSDVSTHESSGIFYYSFEVNFYECVIPEIEQGALTLMRSLILTKDRG